MMQLREHIQEELREDPLEQELMIQQREHTLIQAEILQLVGLEHTREETQVHQLEEALTLVRRQVQAEIQVAVEEAQETAVEMVEEALEETEAELLEELFQIQKKFQVEIGLEICGKNYLGEFLIS